MDAEQDRWQGWEHSIISFARCHESDVRGHELSRKEWIIDPPSDHEIKLTSQENE